MDWIRIMPNLGSHEKRSSSSLFNSQYAYNLIICHNLKNSLFFAKSSNLFLKLHFRTSAKMASLSSEPKFGNDRTRQLLLGELPPDFLRVTPNVQNDTDQQYALALDRQLNYSPVRRLNITVDQAKLTKNYGITRMDPYVRLRVGHYVYETHTDSNGGKTPRWNKNVQCDLPPGVNSISVEIYDERSFTTDELIAWAQIPIPQEIFSGKTHEEWFPLDGKQGECLEGTINLVLSYSTAPPPVSPVVVVPGTGTSLMGCARPYAAVPVYQAPPQPPPPQARPISEEDLKMVEEMFPNLDKDVIKSILEVNNGNREATINSLLQMSQ